MNWHDVIDERSVELHRLIAEKIHHDPALFEIVKGNLHRWLTPPNQDQAIQEWQDYIDNHTIEEVLDFICSWNDEARRMRQSSPFCGILTLQERMNIFKKYESLRT